MNGRLLKSARYVLLVALITGTGYFAFGFLAQRTHTVQNAYTDSSALISPDVNKVPPDTGGSAGLANPLVAPVTGSEKAPGGELSTAVHPSDSGGTDYYQPSQEQFQYQADLTAGQVDDNAKYQEYLDYLSKYQGYNGRVIPIDVSQRLFVRVLDSAQMPVAGASVQLFDDDKQVFAGETMSDGRALFLPKAAGITQATQFRAVISRGQASAEATVQASGPEQVVTLAGLGDSNTGAVGVDLVFLLDATGSMADEIDHIKQTIGSIAQRIEQVPGSSAPRFALVAYRDRGDDYVTRQWDFTSDIDQFSANLANVQAGGGGDIPESVSAGLHDAINLQGWSDNSTGRHLRMIVLVGDAPPHLDYANDYSYPQLLNEAAAKGIKVFPVGASNLEADGEYIFRQFAQVTQGQFVFLTYANGVSGAPGTYTDKHVTDFTVQNLDSLIVGLVAGEVANQTGQKIDTSAQVAPVPVTVPASQTDNSIVGIIGKMFRGDGAIFWGVIVSVVLIVVYATRRDGRQPKDDIREAEHELTDGREHDGEEIWVRDDGLERAEEERELVAAHIQPSFSPVELRMEVRPEQTGQPTLPLR
ncbi:MAG TPA: VWA domain-containing protein [Chloroflexia bacterium]|nr:VWA domain-containing protein [Chloroflexia bacterium]